MSPRPKQASSLARLEFSVITRSSSHFRRHAESSLARPGLVADRLRLARVSRELIQTTGLQHLNEPDGHRPESRQASDSGAGRCDLFG